MWRTLLRPHYSSTASAAKRAFNFASSSSSQQARPLAPSRALNYTTVTIGSLSFLYLAHHHLTSHPLHLEAAPAQPHAPRHIDLARVGFNPDDDDDDGEDDQGHKLVTVDEVRRHRTKESCWVVLGGEVWDVTPFLELHPGGAAVILKQAGQDVTKLFHAVHPPRTFEKNRDSVGRYIGVLDPDDDSAALTAGDGAEADYEAREEARIIEENRAKLPPVESVLGIAEMERLAETVLGKRPKIYYAGGADDEQSLRDQFASFQRCRFRPRVLVDVSSIDPRTTILNSPSPLPIYIAPAAYARLGHEMGEVNLLRGAKRTGVVYGVSANASWAFEDLLDEKRQLDDDDECKGAGQLGGVGMAYQIYVNRDRAKTEELMREAKRGGCSAFFLTVDSPTLGNREADARAQGLQGEVDAVPHDEPNTKSFSYYDSSLNWADIDWIKRSAGGLPVYIKGVATVEDVELAKKYGVRGVVLSNHGGRQLDYARSPLDTLIEINERNPSLLARPPPPPPASSKTSPSNRSDGDDDGDGDFEIYIDGGVRRGTDVLKALCLGARGVGLGRPFLYAQTAYGEQGVIRAVRILEEEIVNGMRLLGVTKLSELRPELIECLHETHRVPGRGGKSGSW